MQIIQKKSSKTLSILKSFQGSGTLFYKLFVFYIVNSNISCFCFYAVIMACKHTALYTNPASCFCLCFNRLCIIYSVKTVLKYKFFQRCIFYRKSKFTRLFSIYLIGNIHHTPNCCNNGIESFLFQSDGFSDIGYFGSEEKAHTGF